MRGDGQKRLTVVVSDKITHVNVKGANVTLRVDDKSGDLTHHDEKFTDGNGQVLFPWTIGGNTNTGTFKVQVNVSALGYQDSNKSDSFIVMPAAAVASSTKEDKNTGTTDKKTENHDSAMKSPQDNPKTDDSKNLSPHTPNINGLEDKIKKKIEKSIR